MLVTTRMLDASICPGVAPWSVKGSDGAGYLDNLTIVLPSLDLLDPSVLGPSLFGILISQSFPQTKASSASGLNEVRVPPRTLPPQLKADSDDTVL